MGCGHANKLKIATIVHCAGVNRYLTIGLCNIALQPENLSMYTAQANAHGNVIVCKGDTVRNSYRIIFTGTYAECLAIKVRGAV
jgi:hypothetical protein